MRFLWQSNAPWAGTGYGAQTKLLLRALKELGHEPNCFAFYGLSGGLVYYDGYPVWPNSDYDGYGNDVVKMHLQRSKSDMLITLMDLFVLDEGIYSTLGMPWAAWTPIDSVGIGNVTLERLKLCTPIAMSQFGAQQIEEAGLDRPPFIYHAVDTDIFKPMDQAECRDLFGIPQDVWLIGMVMANKGDRKQYPLQLKAVRQFMNEHPDYNARAYIHTEPTGAMGGWDMRELVARSGLKNLVYSTNQYDTKVVPHTLEMMAKMYNCFDVLMNCSEGEGFGIPIVEAQSCGIPVVTHGVTAMPEITINGYTVGSSEGHMGGHFGWQFIPSLDDMVYRLDCVYRMASSGRNQMGRDWVINNCSVPVIAQEWHELLKSVEDAYAARRLTGRARIA